MSPLPIARSPDLQRLLEEGYELEARGGRLLIHHVPYVTAAHAAAYGTLVMDLTLADAGTTAQPATHVAYFIGMPPCDTSGSQLSRIINAVGRQDLGNGLVIDVTFSARPQPTGLYDDYYAKVTAYIGLIGAPAAALDADARAQTFRVVEQHDDGSPFRYPDTASARAGIAAANDKLQVGRVAIVGLGGTGSYILDLLAKTPVRDIHLYDGDRFLLHNAFRAPGAAPAEALDGGPNKADHFVRLYSSMRKGLVAHPYFLDESNVDELAGVDFVFLAMDPSLAKRAVVDYLVAAGTPFIDVGMGIQEHDGALGGIIRVTASSGGETGRQIRDLIPYGHDGNDEYSRNIQVADLNCLNAALAVVHWKKQLGFYRDLEGETLSLYTIDGNTIANRRIGELGPA